MLETVTERVALEDGGDGKSGSRIERVRLRDGRRFVVKHVSPAALHDAFRGEPASPELCPLADRYSVLSPATAARERGGPSDLVPALIDRGWERFAELAPAEVTEAVGRRDSGASPAGRRRWRRPRAPRAGG